MKGQVVTKDYGLGWLRVVLCCWLSAVILLISCAAANRAAVHQEDLKKVFPWPRDHRTLEIRVKPKTTLSSTGSIFSSYQKVSVTPDTTFFITDALGQEFAYTPKLMPLRRLVQIKSIEIRWPQGEQASSPDAESKPDR